jgi:glycosyltransferase involved in cell wall biosynthesis
MRVPVLYLITELSTGGAQVALLRLIEGLDRDRFSPAVACLYNGDGAVAQEMRALGIDIFDAQMRHKADLLALLRLYHHIRRARPAILHTSLFHANLPGRILGRLAGLAGTPAPIVVCSERTMAMESEWRYRVNRWTIGLVDCVMVVSANVRDFCISHIGLPAEKLVVIYNGVDLPQDRLAPREKARAELDLPLRAPVVGAVSRLDPVKGVEVLLRAIAWVEDAHLAIVGDGPERASLAALVDDLGLSDRVHWAGQRRDAPHLLSAFDLFVQPSLHEGLPNAVLEAMAAGLPVVATAVGGTSEVVIDEVTGFLVPPRDPQALAQGMRTLLHNSALRRKMGRAGRERVERYFSLEHMVGQTQAVYERLLEGNAR